MRHYAILLNDSYITAKTKKEAMQILKDAPVYSELVLSYSESHDYYHDRRCVIAQKELDGHITILQ